MRHVAEMLSRPEMKHDSTLNPHMSVVNKIDFLHGPADDVFMQNSIAGGFALKRTVFVARRRKREYS